MKYTTIYLEDNAIEVFNNMIGKETVKVNGETVSTKWSFAGTEHLFHIMENDKQLECKLTTKLSMHGVTIDLFKNGKPIIESPKGNFAKFFLLIMIGVFAAGFITEVFLKRLF